MSDVETKPDDAKSVALKRIRLIESAERQVEQFANPESDVHHVPKGGDMRGETLSVICTYFSRTTGKDGGMGRDTFSFVPLESTQLKWFPKGASKKPSKETHHQPCIETYDLQRLQVESVGGPRGTKLKADVQVYPGNVYKLYGARMALVSYIPSGSTEPRYAHKVDVHSIVPVTGSPVEFLLKQDPHSLRIDQPFHSTKQEQVKAAFGDRYPWPDIEKKDKATGITTTVPLEYTESTTAVFPIVPLYYASEIEETRPEFVVAFVEQGLDLARVGYRTRTTDTGGVVRERIFNGVRRVNGESKYTPDMHVPIVFNVKHRFEGENDALIEIKGKVWPESAGQFPVVIKPEDWEMFAGTFLMNMFAVGIANLSSAKEDDDDETDEAVADGGFSVKNITLNVDLARSIESAGVPHPNPVEELKRITKSAWNKPELEGHYKCTRTFPDYKNPDPTKGGQFPTMHRSHARAAAVYSLTGDLNRLVHAIEQGHVDLYVVAPWRNQFTREQMKEFQENKDVAGYTDKSKYPYVSGETTPVMHFVVSKNGSIYNFCVESEYQEETNA